MIEISHQQARRLLREHADRRLPEEQWLALQAHLEGCPECLLYRDRLELVENRLKRVLYTRWRRIDGPPGGMGQAALAARHTRQVSRRHAAYGLLGALGLLVLILVAPGFLRSSHKSLASLPLITPTFDRSTPTLSPDQRFQGVVLFESADKTLNILTAGPAKADVERLSSETYQDSDPAWSPDGEWVAFLSNRATGGKPEIFLTNLVGGRLTQISNDPGVDWEGPPVWSLDGRWVSIIGRRRMLHNEPWVYLVPVDGSGSRVLPGTRWVTGGLRVINDDLSANPNLAFISSLFGGSIIRYDPETGSTGVLTAEDNQKHSLEAGINGGYDYAILKNHYSLVYFAAGVGAPSGFATIQIRSMFIYLNDIARQSSVQQLDIAPQGTLRSVYFIPGDSRIIYLQDPDSSGCFKVSLRDTEAVAARSRFPLVRRLDDLCIAGDIARLSISPNGRWLVAFAHPPGDPHVALYAIGIPPFTRPGNPLSYYLLSEVKNPVGAPIIRPAGTSRAIQPKPVQIVAHDSAPSMVPGGIEGKLLFSAWPEPLAGEPLDLPFSLPRATLPIAPDVAPSAVNSSIELLAPGSGDHTTLLPASSMNACPALSPDGAQMAFLSNRREADREGWQVFVMDMDSQKITRLTRLPPSQDPGDPVNLFDCPVWSPDGKYLASIQHTSFSARLIIMTVDMGVIRSVIVDHPSDRSSLAWTPDGSNILLVEPAWITGPLRVIAFTWQHPTGGNQILAIDGWEDAQAFSISPDGKQLALLLVGAQGAQLRVYRVEGMRLHYKKDLANMDLLAQVRPGRIYWMPENQIAFIFQYRPYERYKSAVVRYSPDDDVISFLVFSEDRIYDWTVNGGWLIYSSESGVWGEEVIGRLDHHPAPIRLADAIAYDLDGK